MKHLEVLLGAPRAEIRDVSNRAGDYYKPFVKEKKPRPFQKIPAPPKRRPIDNPVGRLKIMQRRINKRILGRVVFPEHICAGVKGRNLLNNARIHLGSRELVTLDIRNFFPSISNIQVNRVWREVLDCSPRIAAILTKLTTFERHLPQGAPTSTLLANLVLYSVDRDIRDECSRAGVRYSTWVDDLALSGQGTRRIIGAVVGALSKNGFSVSHRKLRVMGPGDSKVLTGLLLGRRPSATQERLSNLRSGIHKLRTGQIPKEFQSTYARSVYGGIHFVASLVPSKGQRLKRDLDHCLTTIKPEN
jgi:RNA-directed DNA polymerase